MRNHLMREGIGTHRHLERYSDLSFDQISEEISFLMTDFEKRFSRFDEESLLSQLNKKRKILTQDRDFFELLSLGMTAQELSFGAFSLFVGSDLESLGYGKSHQTKFEEDQSLPEVFMDPEQGVISLVGSKNIDLGGVGKGYLIKKLKELFIRHGIEIFRINGGGDIYLQQEDFSQFGAILLQNPLNPEESIGKVPLLKGACCGSGLIFRHREFQGQKHHHLIDPKTGAPAQTLIAGVYVQHEQIEIADMLATSLFVAPIASIEEIARRFGGEYLLIFDDLSSIRSPGFLFEG